MLESGNLSAVPGGGNGADDETARRIAESNGEEDPVVGCGRDHPSYRSNDAAAGVAGNGSYSGLVDRRKGKPSDKRVPLAQVEEVLRLYWEVYFDLNIRHFHEKLSEQHGIKRSYTWLQKALQGAGLVARGKRRGKHRRRRERRPMAGMLLHIDGSKHQWFGDDRGYDLIVFLDDATNAIYYAQLVEEESTRTVMAGLREVIESQGLFCALYSDRGSHFFVTPKAGEKVDKHRLTQVGRAMKKLGVQMIPAYSPQARGRSERSFGTWQGRLPQELRLAEITTAEGANEFLRQHYIAEFNEKFAVPAKQKATAFRKTTRADLNWIFTVQSERVVAKDNTVAIADRTWQLEKTRFRSSLAGCTVTIHEHLAGTVSMRFGPHAVGRYPAPESRGKDGAVETMENQKQVFHPSHRSDDDSYLTNQNPQTSFGKPKRIRAMNIRNRTDHV